MYVTSTDMLQLHSMFSISAPVITAFCHGRRYSRKPNYLITSDSYIFIEAGQEFRYLLPP